MSTSYTAYLIAGIKAEEKTKSVSVTKYNENTGEPYQAKSTEHIRELEDGSELEITDNQHDEFTDAYSTGDFGLVGDYFGFIVGKIDVAYAGSQPLDKDYVYDAIELAGREITKVTGKNIKAGIHLVGYAE